MGGRDVLVIAPESWPLVRANLAELLDVAEAGGEPAALRWLTARHVDYWGSPILTGQLGPRA
jgi:hypothetical protein